MQALSGSSFDAKVQPPTCAGEAPTTALPARPAFPFVNFCFLGGWGEPKGYTSQVPGPSSCQASLKLGCQPLATRASEPALGLSNPLSFHPQCMQELPLSILQNLR